MMRRPYAIMVVITLVALLMVAACGANSTPATSPSGTATTSAKTAACNGLAKVNQVMMSLLNINVDTTVGDIQSAQQKVTTALAAIESKIPNASGDLLNQIKSANQQLTEKLQGYPPDTPIGQTSATVQDLKTNVASAQAKTTLLAAALKCPP